MTNAPYPLENHVSTYSTDALERIRAAAAACPLTPQSEIDLYTRELNRRKAADQ